MRRLSTMARIAALSILFVLLSNLALIAFIHLRTHDDALGALRQRVSAEADVLADVAASAGEPALRSAIADTLDDDRDAVAALIARDGRILAGNVARPIPGDRRTTVFQTGALHITDEPAPQEVGFVLRRLKGGDLLLSGRGFDERMALQQTLERSLILALLLSLLLGVVGGLVIARYVGRRVQAIVAVVDDIGASDLTRRIAVAAESDAFDRLSSRINRMLDRIAKLMDELRLVTDSLAHDLRSPVGRLRARIERALATDDEPERDRLLSGVLTEADALTRMLATMIEIGRSESMAGRKSFASIDAAALIGELAEMYEPLGEEAGMAVIVDADPALPAFDGHRQLLAQALSNLIDNAMLHAAAGGQVTLSAGAAPNGMLRLGIADRGPGIADADRGEALRRFGRLDSSRSRPGAGLGLSLAAAVAHLHGGRLELADNAPGLIATILLPLDTRRPGP